MKVRVMGVDPGMVNCAVFVADIYKTEDKLTVHFIASFMMEITMRDVTDEERLKFEKYCRYLKKTYRPELLICERFQPRGGFLPASIIEITNQMIAVMCVTFKCKTKQITAASWKNQIQKKVNKEKIVDLKEVYKTYKRELGPHRVDASLLVLVQFGFNAYHTHKFLFWLARKSRNTVNKGTALM